MIPEAQSPLVAVPRAPKQKNGMGVASFVLAMIAWVMLLMLLVLSVVVMGEMESVEEPEGALVAIGCCVMLGAVLALVGVGLGIGGCCRPNRGKVLAILGLSFSVVFLFATGVLMLIGMMQ
jgi:hypothetical protein